MFLQMQPVVSYWLQTQGIGNFPINTMTIDLLHAMFSFRLCYIFPLAFPFSDVKLFLIIPS